MRIKDKVAVITGAGSGIGRATALRFASEGARLVLNDYNALRLRETVDAISGLGGNAIGRPGDVAAQREAEALIDAAQEAFGRIDVLCNIAGVNDNFQGVAEVPNDTWDRVMSINLNGPMFLCRRAVPRMREQGGGSIINMASGASLGGGMSGAAYTASKHGLLGLTRSTAWLYSSAGIRCNAVCPGGVDTRILESIDKSQVDSAALKRILQFCSMQSRRGQADEIANLVLFLASDESALINGAVISADAGIRAA